MANKKAPKVLRRVLYPRRTEMDSKKKKKGAKYYQCSAPINEVFQRVIALSDLPTKSIRRATLTFTAGTIAIAYCTRCRQPVAWASRLGCSGKWGACSVFIDDDICLIVVRQVPGPGQNRRRNLKVQFVNYRRHDIICVSLDWLLVLASFPNRDAVARIPFWSSPPRDR